MRAALGLFSLEEGLTALTAGTAATATAALSPRREGSAWKSVVGAGQEDVRRAEERRDCSASVVCEAASWRDHPGRSEGGLRCLVDAS